MHMCVCVGKVSSGLELPSPTQDVLADGQTQAIVPHEAGIADVC